MKNFNLKTLILAPIFIVFFSPILLANSNHNNSTKAHWIQIQQNQCLHQAHTTLAMLNCNAKADKAWDTELNQVYKELINQLTPQLQKQLRVSQRQWLKFKGQEIIAINAMFNDLNGSLYRVLASEARINITKSRVITLQSYLNTYSQNQ